MNYSWKLDDFDTKVFGFNVAKITDIQSEEDIQVLISEFKKNKIRYATYRVLSSNIPIIQKLQINNFILVDGLITLGVSLLELKTKSPDGHIRDAKKNDLPMLEEMTKGLYLLSRIYNDSLISKAKADEFFVRWIENSILSNVADLVLVWEENSKILGYITLQKKGQIPLIGVSKQARGKGIGKKLIEASLQKFKKWGVKEVIIETQMSNIPALRLDQDCGFKPVSSHLTFRWANND